MLIAKFTRNFLETIHENKQLVQTIQNILKSLPEGVIIESKNDFTNQYVVKFANVTAKTTIFNKDPEDIALSVADLKIEVVNSNIDQFKQLENVDSDQQINMKKFGLSNILNYHKSHVDEDEEFSSALEIKSSLVADKRISHFIVKTVKVKWTTCNCAFMHVLTDVTSIKQYEKERAINE